MDEKSHNTTGGGEEGSIIRSIMIEQEEHDRELDPLTVVLSAISGLKDREKEIVMSRYGLADGNKATLDAVGKKFEITRERVRQIESAAIKRIATKMSKDLLQLTKAINHHMIECGGVIALEELVKYFRLSNSEVEANALRLIMEINPEVVSLGKTDLLKTGWASRDFPQTMLTTVAKIAESELIKAGHPLTSDEIWERYLQDSAYDANSGMNMSVFIGVMRLSERIAEAGEGMWGLTSWPTVVPKRIRDKVYLVLEKAGKPMHFREIADEINSVHGGKPVLSRTVHNELIGDDRFVLVGRGIYALKSQGFAPGVVLDVIKDVLKNAGKPLTTDEIVEKVLLTRQVKRNTVIANLQNREDFTKIGKSMYKLAE